MYKLKSVFFSASVALLIFVTTQSCKKLKFFDANDESDTTEVTFTHPGILFNNDDITRIRSQVTSGHQPWAGSFLDLKQAVDQRSMSGPYSIVERSGGSPEANALSSDSQLAYRSAVLWFITQDSSYAYKSREVLDAWSSTLTSLTGGDNMLVAAWYGFCLVNAAEILKNTDSGWSQDSIEQAEQMFQEVFYPVIQNWKRGRAGNWDTAITKTIMAFAVFLDDEEMFNSAVDFFYSTTESSNGTLNKNIYQSGQNFESARDQQHAQMGLVGLLEACEIGWKQGLDMYGAMDNRLLKGFEYTAKYNLGFDDLPFQSNVYGNLISPTHRGTFQPMYEMVYNHYINRIGLAESDLPYTTQAVAKVRLEQGWERGSAIFPGFGSLLFNAPPNNISVDSIVVNSDDFRIIVGGERRLQAKTFPLNAADYEVFWNVEDTTIAQIDEKGLLKAIGNGTTTIVVATAAESYVKRITVTVVDEAESITASDYAFVQSGAGKDKILDATDSLIVRKGTKATHDMAAYLKFDLSGLDNEISSVCLELTTRVGSQNGAVKLSACESSTWLGNELTYNTRPPMGSLIVSTMITGQAPQRILIDVTDYIKEQIVESDLVSFGLTAEGVVRHVFTSIGDGVGTAPKLIVCY